MLWQVVVLVCTERAATATTTATATATSMTASPQRGERRCRGASGYLSVIMMTMP